MDLGLNGKIAWVLGGSSGLGLGSATSLAREGTAVAISARDEARLQEAAAGIEKAGGRCLAVTADASDADQLAKAHDRITSELGPVDVLVANAGGPPPGSFESFDDDALEKAFTLTTESAWRLAQLCTPGMKNRGGCLIFITSVSVKEPIPGLLLSNMMRPAVVGMAKTLSKELARDGIRVLCVAPGRIQTPRIDAIDRSIADTTGISVEEARKQAESFIPLGRAGRTEEFGDVVAFLASERASYLTGITVAVDGGSLNSLLA